MLRPTDQVLASPTLLDILPGVRQRIWLLPGQPASAVGEQAYRVVLAPTTPGLPRYSLPLFRGHATPMAHRRLHAGIEPGQSHTFLRLSNTGTLHAACTISPSSPAAVSAPCCPAWPAICWPAMSAAGPCPPAPMATPAAISRPGCRMAA
jgi:hypothetical protein